jgi:tRNA(Ile)-lysidine synthase
VLTSDDREHLFAPLAGAQGLLLAISGGPDSMALLQLAADWRAEDAARPPLFAASVDHGLRPESRAEAQDVARAAQAFGVPHAILAWEGEKPRAGLQERARAARYDLLVRHARAIGADSIVTAHHMDDQAETLLMRLSRGTGVAGLAGMRARSLVQGLALLRPLLSVRKADLIEVCEASGLAFAQDASNLDPRFARVRMRRLAAALAREGLTVERLHELARRAQRADEALDLVARHVAQRLCVTPSPEGLNLSLRALAGEPEEIVLRVLLLATQGVAPTPVRLGRFEAGCARLLGALRAGEALSFTLAGALWRLDRDGTLRIAAEPARRRGRLSRHLADQNLPNCGQTSELVHLID